MLVGWGKAYGAFVRGLVYMRKRLEEVGEEERARTAAAVFCCARYTGLSPGDGGPWSVRSWERHEVHAAAMWERVEVDAVLAAWSLGSTLRGVFQLLWAEDDRITLELAQAYLRRVLSDAGKGDEGTCVRTRDDAPRSAA